MFKPWVISLCLVAATSANADSLDTLAQFLKQTSSMKADFVQVVTSPPKDGRPSKSKTSLGTFAFIRPMVFRFDYSKPFVQNIVADGRQLWLFDADLNQVTVRNQAQALGSTPATLIASAYDLATLGKAFELKAVAPEGSLEWVLATPKNTEGSLQHVRIGLRLERDQVLLAQLDIMDAFGIRSQIRFEHVLVNPSHLTPAQFNFVPPKGADLIQP
ncbi:MAG: outer membrane lipoprotein carrier protein LolA [Betaproteobacteria bacterium]|nr:outer membrane lipoprotein carrier protein LolA [Betaproteobacteria bacterium]